MGTAAQKLAATNPRNFRTFLLMQQFAADEIGARITQARKERGLTQEQLAEMASFSKRSLQDYEGGVTIPYRHMQELARLLSRPQEWFLYGEQEQASAGERLEQIDERLARIEEALGIARGQRPGPQAVRGEDA
jgi:transcriptional regulator with XRE-family HTH domain